VLKGPRLIAKLAQFVAHSWIGSAFFKLRCRDEGRLRAYRCELNIAYGRSLLRILGVNWAYESQSIELTANRGRLGLVVCNHLSYVDVLMLAARGRVVFVTSEETREDPFLGLLCELAGCIFVERRNRSRRDLEVDEIARALRSGLDVAAFPEATSSNGERVLPFKAMLFEAAVRAASPVTGFCLRYHEINGVPIGLETRDSVFYYGAMKFVPHIGRLLRLRSVRATLCAVDWVGSAASADRQELRARFERSVSQAYGSPFESASG